MEIEMVIEIYKHKTTGKYFIYIQDTSADEALFINPEGRILPLPLSFFEDGPKEGEADDLFSKYPITKEQLERFVKYTQNRMNKLPQD